MTGEGWEHILGGHAEMTDRLSEIGAVVARPSLVMRDRRVRRAELLYGDPVGRLRVVVVVIYRPTADGWVGDVWTAHLTARTQEGEQLWP
ncbi:MAG TPA: hypothetical protein VH482_14795 [Thermomicrobiales bacterium]